MSNKNAKPNLCAFNGLKPGDPHEIKLILSAKDLNAYCALSKERWAEGDSVVVTDIPTRARFRLQRANCGAGCFCAASAVPADVVLGTVDINALDRVASVLRKALKDEADDKIDDGKFRDLIVGAADDLEALATNAGGMT